MLLGDRRALVACGWIVFAASLSASDVHWPLDGSTNDVSGEGAHGVIAGAPVYVPGVRGDALLFDGDDDAVGLPPLPIPAESLTVAAWIRLENENRRSRSIFHASASPRDEAVRLYVHNRQNRLFFKNDHGLAIRCEEALALGRWYFVCGTIDAANGVAVLYLDGVECGRDTAFSTSSGTLAAEAFIGARVNANSENFDGAIDDVQLWSRPLTAAEVAAVFSGEPPNTPPVADAGVDQMVMDLDEDGSEWVTLDGTASSDPDGAIDSWQWHEGATLLGSTPVLDVFLPLGAHTITLTVTDDTGDSDSDTVNVRVDPVPQNTPPAAVAGPDQTLIDVDEDGVEWVTLDGSGSSDADGTIEGWQWHEGATLLGDTPVLDVLLPLGSHAITLTVTDDDGDSDSDLIDIIIDPVPQNVPPVAAAGADQTVIDLDDDGVEWVALDGSGSSDPDGTIEGWQWHEGATLLGSSPVLDVLLPLGSHTITLTVTDDDGDSDSDSVAVLVDPAVVQPVQLVRGPYLQNDSPDPTTSILVVWKTDVPSDSLVELGTDLTYGSQAYQSESVLHHAVRVNGLLPGVTYFYRIVSSGTVLAEGPDFFFETSKPSGPTKFFVVGDDGIVAPFNQIIQSRDYDFGVHVGDVVDNGYDEVFFNDERTNGKWGFREIIRNKVIFPSLGDHDLRDCPPVNPDPYDPDCFFGVFHRPTVDGEERHYFSFDYGDVHFVFLPIGNDQQDPVFQAWLDTDLANSTQPWKIAIIHAPYYPCGGHPAARTRDQIEPILNARGVDLVISGDNHYYARTFPIIDDGSVVNAGDDPNYVNPAGIIYVISGASDGPANPLESCSFIARGSDEFAEYTEVEVDGNRLTLNVLVEDGTVWDTMTITK